MWRSSRTGRTVVLEIVQEDLRGLEKRLAAYPGNTVRMQAKFERLREMRERGGIPSDRGR